MYQLPTKAPGVSRGIGSTEQGIPSLTLAPGYPNQAAALFRLRTPEPTSLGLDDADQITDRPMSFDGVPKRLARPDDVMILPAHPLPLDKA